MLAKHLSVLSGIAILGFSVSAHAQAPAANSGGTPASKWINAASGSGGLGASDRRASVAGAAPMASGRAAAIGEDHQAPAPGSSEPRGPIARVTGGSGVLPNDHGQLWREYDISPYTTRVTSTNRPEQAIVDWILRDTGYEVWHSEPLSILSADQRTLRVYHTPEMHQLVADIVDRFVSTQAETHAFGLRLITLSHPNWRARSQQLLQPVQVQTPGAQAWLLQKEDAALLLSELRRRSDYREHSSPHLLVNNGQSTVVSATRGQNYVRSAFLRSDAWPVFEPETAVIDEGFSLEFSPLLSVDGQFIDATIKCEIDQIEKMIPISLEIPSAAAPRQRTKIEVPQTSHFRFHERFRWPVDQVLLVAMGMVALPVPSDGQTLVPGLPLRLPASPPRADVLVFVESKGKTGHGSRVTQAQKPQAAAYRGRYE